MNRDTAIDKSREMKMVAMKVLRCDDCEPDFDVVYDSAEFIMFAYHSGFYAYVIADYRNS